MLNYVVDKAFLGKCQGKKSNKVRSSFNYFGVKNMSHPSNDHLEDVLIKILKLIQGMEVVV